MLVHMTSTRRQRRRVLLPVGTGFACLSTALVGITAGQPAQAAPWLPPNVSLQTQPGVRGTGCKYLVSVVATDHQAPMKLKVVDQQGRVVQNLKTRNERRGEGDPRRVVEGDWIPKQPGWYRVVATQNGVSTKTKPIEVRPGFSTGSSCSGF